MFASYLSLISSLMSSENAHSNNYSNSGTKPKHFKTIVSDLKSRREALIAHPSQKDVYCDVVTFDDLTSSTVDTSDESDQKSKAVTVKCLHVARSGEEPPATLIVTDSNGTVMAISIYNLSLDAVQYASKCDTITLVDPVVSETLWPSRWQTVCFGG